MSLSPWINNIGSCDLATCFSEEASLKFHPYFFSQSQLVVYMSGKQVSIFLLFHSCTPQAGFANIETFSVMNLKLLVIIGLMDVSSDECTDSVGVLLFILLV